MLAVKLFKSRKCLFGLHDISSLNILFGPILSKSQANNSLKKDSLCALMWMIVDILTIYSLLNAHPGALKKHSAIMCAS